MASNVIAQPNGVGEYTFTNLDNTYGGATTELIKLKEGEVSVFGGVVTVTPDGATLGGGALSVTSESVTVGSGGIVTPYLEVTGQASIQKTYKTVNVTGATSTDVDKDVIFINNTNGAPCTLTLNDTESARIGDDLKLVFIGTSASAVTVSGDIVAAGGTLNQITGKGGMLFVYGEDSKWHHIAQAQ